MYITIINDCNDGNAVGRQQTRIAALFGTSPSFVPVTGDLSAAGELEAAGNIIDCLDAAGDAGGVILANVAPRSGSGKNYPNGTPFGYFVYKQTLVATSIAGLTLSLAKKLELFGTVNVFDIPEVMTEAVRLGLLPSADAERTVLSQFRSFDFLPRAAFWLQGGNVLPSEPLAASAIPDAPRAIWMVDNFGNCKTTLFAQELEGDEGITVRRKFIKRYARLKDVPDKEFGVIIGSSGLGENRFVEIVLQGGSAARELDLHIGSLLE